MSINAIEFKNITKQFPGIKANDDVSFKVKKGSIHALIGENGAGKSTLMSILFGLYQPTFGKILIDGNEIIIKNPNQANDIGIGMVHQHFKIVNSYSNLQNIVLGAESKMHGFLSYKFSCEKIRAIQKQFELRFDLNEITTEATIATQQKIEITKMLFRDAEILIFDEPTAVLTPQEIQSFLESLKNFRNQGKTVIFISHKLNEIKEVADSATVLRLGKVIADFASLENVSINDLSVAMVGSKVVAQKNLQHEGLEKQELILEVENLNTKGHKKLDNVSFNVHAGEIFAIAGVEGNGQEELEFTLSGLLKPTSGVIKIKNFQRFKEGYLAQMKKPKIENGKVDITKFSVSRKANFGISYVPADRHRYGLLLDINIRLNSIIRRLKDPQMHWRGWIKYKNVAKFFNEIQSKFDVRGTNEGNSLARSLSGGNQQKAIVGRELLTKHQFLIIVQPTRGLDVGAINNIHKYILEEKSRGIAIILISYELDEILAIADTVAVINKGSLSQKIPITKINREKIGLMMAGGQYE